MIAVEPIVKKLPIHAIVSKKKKKKKKLVTRETGRNIVHFDARDTPMDSPNVTDCFPKMFDEKEKNINP